MGVPVVSEGTPDWYCAAAMNEEGGSPIESDSVVRLHSSRVGWLTGLVFVAFAVLCAAGIVFGIAAAADSERSSSSRGLVIVGLVLATPPVLVAAALMANAGWRMVRPRHARIELGGDRLVIRDRWLLRRPMEIRRGEVRAISRLPQVRRWQFSVLLGNARGRDVAYSGPLLDWGTVPNCALEFTQPRRLDEAIRTVNLNYQSMLEPVSRGTTTSVLLLRVVNPDESMRVLNDWMGTAKMGRGLRAPAPGPGGCSGCLLTATMWLAAITGFSLFCIGLATA